MANKRSNDISWAAVITYFIGTAILIIVVQNLPRISVWWVPIFIAPIGIALWVLQDPCFVDLWIWDRSGPKFFRLIFALIGTLALLFLAAYHLSSS
jgi:uncharacterized membrane protein YeaQ/YmgE (transglycosylase-associated protein family)